VRLTYLTLAWLAGIALAGLLWERDWLACQTPPAWLWLAVALGLGGAAYILHRRVPAMARLLALALMLALALARYQAHPLTPCLGAGDLAYYNGTENAGNPAMLTGVIDGYPQRTAQGSRYRLRVRTVEVSGTITPVSGLALVQGPPYPAYAYGDLVEVTGQLLAPPQLEDFDYRAYLARQGVFSLVRRARVTLLGHNQGHPLWAALYAVRARGVAVLAQLLPEPAAGLAQGILLGVDDGIAQELYDLFNLTGTSHVIVISGSNISLVAGLLAAAAARVVGKRFALYIVLTGLAGYVCLVGADPAVMRAGLMGALAVLAVHLGRQNQALTSLAAAVFVMTLINPLDLGNTGFQLSALATLGLILFAPPLQAAAGAWLENRLPAPRARQALGLLNDAVLITLAANVITLPLIVYTFHRLPVVSLLANMLILPAQPPVMLWGGAALVLGLVPALIPLARLVALVPWLCLNYTVAVVRWTSALPGASLELPPLDVGWLVAAYGLIFGLFWWTQQPRGQRRRWVYAFVDRLPAKALLLGLLVVMLLVWLAVGQLPDGRLRVTFLDVGQGDAILIQTPQGNQVLIDGGPDPGVLFAELGAAMPFWDHDLDLVVNTHTDADHLAGLVPLLERYRAGHVLVNGFVATSQTYAQWQANLAQAGVPVMRAQTGGRIRLDDGVWLDILSPDARLFSGTEADSNNNSVVLRLSYGRFAVLLTGDAEAVVEETLRREGRWLQATVLKVPHHGSLTSSTTGFITAVQPQLGVIEVGADNEFGHPRPEVLARYRELGIPILRTDQHGTITLASDGARFWVGVER
jgi:competence protein ComEC